MNEHPTQFLNEQIDRSHEAKRKVCEEVGAALDGGKLGEIVAKHERLILHYYKDVQEQAKRSFDTALRIAQVGFGVLIATLVCAVVLDVLSQYYPGMTKSSLTVARVGVVSGFIIELIAGTGFWLYSRGARQFGAFHICLERTHRYLLAYKIADQLGSTKGETLRDLVCIMANAPMISFETVESSVTRQQSEPPRSSQPSDANRSTR